MASISRRRILQGTAIGAGAWMAGRSAGFAQQSGPLKIPVLTTLSGPLSIIGVEVKTGAEITAKLINDGGGIAGRSIEPMVLDDKGRPNDAVAVAREVIAQGYNYLGGVLLSSQLLALQPLLAETKTVVTASSGASVAFTNEAFSRYVFPGLESEYVSTRAMAILAAQKFPNATSFTSVISESQPFIQSYVNFRKFARPAYEAIGKHPEFAEPLVVKIGTADFRNQLSLISSSNADAFYNYVIGADAVTFWQQARAYNLNEKLKAVADLTLDFTMLKSLKKNMPPNLWFRPGWYHGLHEDEPLSRAFYKEYVGRTGDTFPSGYMNYGCMCVAPLAEAIKQSGGKTDTETLIGQLESIKFHTLKGATYFRKEDHFLVGDMDFAKIISTDEEPGLKVVNSTKFSTGDLAPAPNPGKPFPL